MLVIHLDSRNLELFDPTRYRLNDAAFNYGIEEAKRFKEWPILEEAVDAKIAEQKEVRARTCFLAPDAATRRAGNPGIVRERGQLIPVPEADFGKSEPATASYFDKLRQSLREIGPGISHLAGSDRPAAATKREYVRFCDAPPA